MSGQTSIGHAVIVVGGGPTGLMLAAELALAGVDVAIVERRSGPELIGTRARGLHARTLEIFDQRGIVDRFLAEGQVVQVNGFAGVHFDLSSFPSPHPYGLALWQTHTERILAGWADELGVRVYREAEVTGLGEDADGVEVALSDGRTMRAQYVVGCDGGRSFVRKAAGIAFPGAEPTASNIIAEVEMTETPPWGIHRDARGIHSFARADYEIRDGKVIYADAGPIGVLVTEANPAATGEPTIEELREALMAARGTDYGLQSVRTISRFSDAARQAATYRKGRVLIAGDAAHIHPPDGGQGLQTGVQDAVNLGWKLAQVVAGISPESLLDTYGAERHPVGALVLRHAMAAAVLRRDDERTRAVRETIAELLGVDAARNMLAAELSGLAVAYDFGPGHTLLGRRMPDLELATAMGPTRMFALLHKARPVLVNLGALGSVELGPWAGRVELVEASTDGPWELPGFGPVSAPSVVLIRPDGHVAWVGEGSAMGLTEALGRWFGPPLG